MHATSGGRHSIRACKHAERLTDGGAMRFLAALVLLVPLAACDEAESAPSQSQRVSLQQAGSSIGADLVTASDSEGAEWQVTSDGRGIRFGRPEEAPLLTLACDLENGEAPQMDIIRHVISPPGAKALFAVLGNGVNARLYLDARLEGNEWRWEGSYPADDPLLDVFTGRREITATLPGGGMLEISGSPLPGEFVTWCRDGGEADKVENDADEAGETDKLASEESDPKPAA